MSDSWYTDLWRRREKRSFQIMQDLINSGKMQLTPIESNHAPSRTIMGVVIQVDPTLPPNTIEFRNADGSIAARIINVGIK
jgi:hypothetical protein